MNKPQEMKQIGNAQAIIDKVQTLRDGGFRLTLDMPDTELLLIQELMRIKSTPGMSPIFYVAFVQKLEGY
jgi:hypothetical protein